MYMFEIGILLVTTSFCSELKKSKLNTPIFCGYYNLSLMSICKHIYLQCNSMSFCIDRGCFGFQPLHRLLLNPKHWKQITGESCHFHVLLVNF